MNKTSAIYRDLNDEAFRRIALGQNYFDLIGPGRLMFFS